MQSDADLQLLLRFVADLESLHSLENLKGHSRNLSRVVLTVSQGKSRHHHVSVTNRLNLEMHKVNIQKIRKAYLIYIKLGYDVVKECVQIIEQFHNLKRIIKGDYAVCEVDGGRFGVGGSRGKKKGKFYLKSCARGGEGSET